MSAPNILADVFGGMLILVGLTVFNGPYITAAMDELARSKALTWLTGLLTFVIGVASVAFYHAWTSDWRVIITIFGWLTVLKGAFISLLPTSSIALYRKLMTRTLLPVIGVVAIVLGLIVLYLGMNA
jgi:hypothetical protein